MIPGPFKCPCCDYRSWRRSAVRPMGDHCEGDHWAPRDAIIIGLPLDRVLTLSYHRPYVRLVSYR